MTSLLNSRSGEEEFKDLVLVSDQAMISLEKLPPGTPLASSPALELRKNSVPLFLVLFLPAGASAGQTVKPG